MSPKTYLIVLKNHQPSEQLASECLLSAERFNWNVEVFPAVNGNTITEQTWLDYGLKNSGHRPADLTYKGTQGCFLSHYMLWKRCAELDQPIIVLEDDAEVLGPIPEIVTDKDLIKLHDPRQMHEHKKLGSWAPGAFAYWLTPQGAKKIIDWAKNDGPGHADKLIGSNVLNWDYLNPHIVKLGPRIGSSTNPNRYPYREFVG